MRITIFIIGTIFCHCTGVVAGVSEYFVYDKRNRFILEKLDAVASAQIKHYYAFADVGLVRTHYESKKKALVIGDTGGNESISTDSGGSAIFTSFPYANAGLQLRRNTLWVFDIEITECFYGTIETNHLFIAMKQTNAYKNREYPHNIIKRQSEYEILFGLVEIDELEFEKSFLGLVCYLKDDLSIFNTDVDNTLSIYKVYNNNYNKVFGKLSPSACFVVRDVGVPFKFGVGPKPKGGVIKIDEESELKRAVKEGEKKGVIGEKRSSRQGKPGVSGLD